MELWVILEKNPSTQLKQASPPSPSIFFRLELSLNEFRPITSSIPFPNLYLKPLNQTPSQSDSYKQTSWAASLESKSSVTSLGASKNLESDFSHQLIGTKFFFYFQNFKFKIFALQILKRYIKVDCHLPAPHGTSETPLCSILSTNFAEAIQPFKEEIFRFFLPPGGTKTKFLYLEQKI